ncbi:hypothetical protein V8C86DRAFT_2664781 [Haematococcus lacustris]
MSSPGLHLLRLATTAQLAPLAEGCKGRAGRWLLWPAPRTWAQAPCCQLAVPLLLASSSSSRYSSASCGTCRFRWAVALSVQQPPSLPACATHSLRYCPPAAMTASGNGWLRHDSLGQSEATFTIMMATTAHRGSTPSSHSTL